MSHITQDDPDLRGVAADAALNRVPAGHCRQNFPRVAIPPGPGHELVGPHEHGLVPESIPEVEIVGELHMKRQFQRLSRLDKARSLTGRIAVQKEQGEAFAQHVEDIAARTQLRRRQVMARAGLVPVVPARTCWARN